MAHFNINFLTFIVAMVSFACNNPNAGKTVVPVPIFNFKDISFSPVSISQSGYGYGYISFMLSHNFSAPLYINHQSMPISGHQSTITGYWVLDMEQRTVSDLEYIVNCGDIRMNKMWDTLNVGESHKYKVSVYFPENDSFPETYKKYQYIFFSCPLDFVTTDSTKLLAQDRRLFKINEKKNENYYFSTLFRFYFNFEKRKFRSVTEEEFKEIFEGEKKFEARNPG